LSITECLNIDHPKIDDALTLLHETYIGSITEMKTIPVTEAEITSIIRSLKNKHSTGYDGVSSRILKYGASEISKPYVTVPLNLVFILRDLNMQQLSQYISRGIKPA
jgi:hypothetical protein